MNYTIHPRAWLDLEETMTYLRDQAGDEMAVRYWAQAQETFAALTRQPFLGRPRPDLNPPGLRSWRVNGFENWLIFYQAGAGIEIFRVRHGMMDLPKVFRKE
jgi:plasmid stabilization system protein ParE